MVYGAKAAGADVEGIVRFATGGAVDMDQLPKIRDDDAEMRWNEAVTSDSANASSSAFAVMAGLGAALCAASLVGFLGVCIPKTCFVRVALFGAYILQMAMCVAMSWAAAMCFAWPATARDDVNGAIDAWYDVAAEAFAEQGTPAHDRVEAKKFLADHILNAGIFFVTATVLALANMWSIAELIGHAFTSRALVISTSIASLLASLVLGGVSLAVALKGTYGDWAAYLLALLALFAFLVSIMGIVGASRLDAMTLGMHSFTLLLLTMLIGCVGAVTFALPNDADVFVRSRWHLIEEHIVGENATTSSTASGTTEHLDTLEREARAHFDTLGVVAVSFAVLLGFNAFASVYALRESLIIRGLQRAAQAVREQQRKADINVDALDGGDRVDMC